MHESVRPSTFHRLDRQQETRCRHLCVGPVDDGRKISIGTDFFLMITTFWLATSSTLAFANGDPVKGKVIFNQCSGCHTTTLQDKIGPHLARVFGRGAGTAAGFHYSKTMTSSGAVWNGQTLDTFLAAPSMVFPGTSMPVSPRNAQERVDVIAYKSLGSLNSASFGRAEQHDGRSRNEQSRDQGPMAFTNLGETG
jgi:cytochrome c